METVISSIITGIVAIVVCMLNNKREKKNITEQNHATMALIQYRLDEISEQIDVVRDLEVRVAVIEEKLKTIA